MLNQFYTVDGVDETDYVESALQCRLNKFATQEMHLTCFN